MASTRPTIKKCPTCGRRTKRTSEQNRRLWALYAMMASRLKPGGNLYTPEQYHIFAKLKFLGAVEHKLPNGSTMTIPNSSADLDVSEFTEFLTQVEAWAAEHNVWLED